MVSFCSYCRDTNGAFVACVNDTTLTTPAILDSANPISSPVSSPTTSPANTGDNLLCCATNAHTVNPNPKPLNVKIQATQQSTQQTLTWRLDLMGCDTTRKAVILL